ncbi:MAG: hypothetical protein ACREXU_19945, partial [Gammaproteobacteria bacterium]
GPALISFPHAVGRGFRAVQTRGRADHDSSAEAIDPADAKIAGLLPPPMANFAKKPIHSMKSVRLRPRANAISTHAAQDIPSLLLEA